MMLNMYKKLLMMGAITDKVYQFQHRPWELTVIQTVDIEDILGTYVKVYTYGSEVKRVLPLKNDTINEEWISNKTRYFYNRLKKWRLNIPLIKKKEKKKTIMINISWSEAFAFFFIKLWFCSFYNKSKNLIILNGLFGDYETIITSKLLAKKLGFISYNKINNININDYYLFYINPNFLEIIKKQKIFIMLGCNLRIEAPILNIKLRKKMLKENIIYTAIGSNFNDNLNSVNIGLNIKNIIKYLQGNLKVCSLIKKKIKDINLNMFLLGNNIVNRIDNKNIFSLILKYMNLNALKKNYILTKKNYISNLKTKVKNYRNSFWENFDKIKTNLNILYLNLSYILYEDLNLNQNINNYEIIDKNNIIFIIGGLDLNKLKKFNYCIFQGYNINLNTTNIDLALPSTTFIEKSSKYLSIEGKVLETNFILYPPMFSRNDWSILNAFYIYLIGNINKIYKLNYINITELNKCHYDLSFGKKQDISKFLLNWSPNLILKKITKITKKNKGIIKNIFINIQNCFIFNLGIKYEKVKEKKLW